MAFDEKLAARVRNLLADRPDLTERRMFGGLTFMLRGHLCCGVHGDELILRIGPDGADEALASPHACPMDFTGRPLAGFVTVSRDGLSGRALAAWSSRRSLGPSRCRPRCRNDAGRSRPERLSPADPRIA
jgi:hypothetical protein